jgi:hypothetical protein
MLIFPPSKGPKVLEYMSLLLKIILLPKIVILPAPKPLASKREFSDIEIFPKLLKNIFSKCD